MQNIYQEIFIVLFDVLGCLKVAVIPNTYNKLSVQIRIKSLAGSLSRRHHIEAPVSRGVLLFQPGLKQEFLAVKFLLPGSRIFTDSEHDRVKYKFSFYFAAISRGRGSMGGHAVRHKTRVIHASPRVWVSLNGESRQDFGYPCPD